MSPSERTIYRWDSEFEPNEGDMEFRLTYANALKSHRDDNKKAERSIHKHKIRQCFHRQLKELWRQHPMLKFEDISNIRDNPHRFKIFRHDGFNWLPLVTEQNGLICKIDVLMLRYGDPGEAAGDADNRLKTVIDALRKARSPAELGEGTKIGKQTPESDEDPFFVLLEDDKLITHLSLTTDRLLEAIDPSVPKDQAVRLVINVTIRPYRVHMENIEFI